MLLSIASISFYLVLFLYTDLIFFIVFSLSFKVSNSIPALIIMKMNPLLYIQLLNSIQVPL